MSPSRRSVIRVKVTRMGDMAQDLENQLEKDRRDYADRYNLDPFKVGYQYLGQSMTREEIFYTYEFFDGRF